VGTKQKRRGPKHKSEIAKAQTQSERKAWKFYEDRKLALHENHRFFCPGALSNLVKLGYLLPLWHLADGNGTSPGTYII